MERGRRKTEEERKKEGGKGRERKPKERGDQREMRDGREWEKQKVDDLARSTLSAPHLPTPPLSLTPQLHVQADTVFEESVEAGAKDGLGR